jgi:hypothetical protein
MNNELSVTLLQKEEFWVSNYGLIKEEKYITMQFKKRKNLFT